MKRVSTLSLPMRVFWFLCYAVIFLWGWAKANIDIVYRLVRPSMSARSGMVKVRTALSSEIALTFLSCAVTFMPGLAVIDVDKADGTMLVHWLDIPPEYDINSGNIPAVNRCAGILQKVFE